MITPRTPSPAFLNRAKSRRFMHLARVMSGEIRGFGAKVERIHIDPSGRACTDGKTIWIPETMNDDARVNNVMQEAILAHECAHHRYTDFQSWNNKVVQPIKKQSEDPMLHQMTNMIEDARINHLFSQDYAGAGRMLDFTHAQFMQDHKKQTTDESPVKQQAMVAMMSECIAYEGHWSTNDRVIAFMDEVRPILSNATKQPDTNSVIGQARRVLDLFRSHFPDDEADPEDQNADFTEGQVEKAAEGQQQQGRNPQRANRSRFQDMKEPTPPTGESKESDESESGSDGSADGSDGSGEENDEDSGSQGSGDAEGDGEQESTESDSGSTAEGDGDGESADDGNGTDSDQDGSEGGYGGQDNSGGGWEETWADLLDRSEGDLSGDFDNARTMTKDYDQDLDAGRDGIDQTTTTFDGSDHEVHVVAAIDRKTGRSYSSSNTFAPEDIQQYSATYDQISRRNRSGIKIIQNEMTRRIKGSDPAWINDQRSGKVDTSAVWKLAGSKGESSRRIFRTKTDPTDAQANVIVLIDASGSMGSAVYGEDGGFKTRADCASEAAVVMSEVLDGLNFNYEIMDFATGRGTTMRIRKAFNTDLSRASKATLAAPYSTGCNADGFAVQWCLDRLSSMGGNQILIVISDGQPAGNADAPNGMSDEEHLRHVVHNSPKGVGIVGVGIAGSEVEQFYENAVKVSDTSRLGREMIPVLRTMLRKVVVRQ